jgi:hypothetical protein
MTLTFRFKKEDEGSVRVSRFFYVNWFWYVYCFLQFWDQT